MTTNETASASDIALPAESQVPQAAETAPETLEIQPQPAPEPDPQAVTDEDREAAQAVEAEEELLRAERAAMLAEPLPPVKNELLISVIPHEECRIAITVNGKLDDYFQERAGSESHVGGIYKGRVRQINTAVQAAFIDIGLPQNAFLHISDVHPRYFPGAARDEVERVGIKTARRDRPLMQQCFKKGDEVLVQVIKEGLGSKGPTVTAYLSVPGRYIVMMPWMDELGVSKKVEDPRLRAEMRDMLRDLEPPEGFGFILRTEAAGKTIHELKRDLNYLQRVWKNIDEKKAALKGLGEMYAESDLVIRTLRDIYTAETQRITVDDLASARRCRDFLKATDPHNETQVLYYADQVPLFQRRNIESQIQAISDRVVPLPSGGALVIDQTEAMVAIDVNSGRSRSARDAETNAYETNLEAVDEICRQLRLRDLGGIVCLDLIDMFHIHHRKKVEIRLLSNLKRDRAKTNVGIISPVCGVLPMTRQRMRPSISKNLTHECPHCGGLGHVSTPETVANAVLRRLQMVLNRADVARTELTVAGDVAFILLNTKRGQLAALEKQCGKQVLVRVGGRVDAYDIAAFTVHGAKLTVSPADDLRHLPEETAAAMRDVDDPSLPEDAGAEFREDELILQDHTETDEVKVKPLAKPEQKLAQGSGRLLPGKPAQKPSASPAAKPAATETADAPAGEAAPEAKQEARPASKGKYTNQPRSQQKPAADDDQQPALARDARNQQQPKHEQSKHEQPKAPRPPAPAPAPKSVHPPGTQHAAIGLPEGVPVPPKNFPGLSPNGAKARVNEVMEALGVTEQDMVDFVRKHNLERIQSLQTRMHREEVMMAWTHFKGAGNPAAPAPAEAAAPVAEQAAPDQRPAAPKQPKPVEAQTQEAPAKTPAAKTPAPPMPEKLAKLDHIRVHDITEVVGMSVTKTIHCARDINIHYLKSGQTTVDAHVAARIVESCIAWKVKNGLKPLPIAYVAENPAPETPAASAPAPAPAEVPAPAAAEAAASAEEAPKRGGKTKTPAKAEKPAAKTVKKAAKAKAEKPEKAAAKTVKAKAEPKAEPKKTAKKETEAKPKKTAAKTAAKAAPEPKKAEPKAPVKKAAEPAKPFRKRQAPPVPGEAGKRKVFGGPKRGRE